MGPPSPSLSRRASRPLPSPLSFTGACSSYCRRDAAAQEDLPRQGDIGLRAFAFAIELHGGDPRNPRPREVCVSRESRPLPPPFPRPPPIRPPLRYPSPRRG